MPEPESPNCLGLADLPTVPPAEYTLSTFVVSSLCRSQNPQDRGVAQGPQLELGASKGSCALPGGLPGAHRSVGNGLSPVQRQTAEEREAERQQAKLHPPAAAAGGLPEEPGSATARGPAVRAQLLALRPAEPAGLTTRPRSPASRPWRRPASEPVCYLWRDPGDPGPAKGSRGLESQDSRPLSAADCTPPGIAAPSTHPPALAPTPFSFGWKRRRERAGKDAPLSPRCLRGPAPAELFRVLR